jgi:putative membrane protein
MTKQKIIPKWASLYISEQEIQQIEAKITEIEVKTTGEVIVLIVKQSSFVRYVKPALFFIFMIISLFTLNWYLHDLWFTLLEKSMFYMVDLVLVYLLAAMLAKLTFFQRVLLHPVDMQEAFQRRAVSEYYENNLYKTKYNTAVLMMISVLEKKAIVLASHELDKEVDGKLWSECVNEIITGAKSKNLGKGFLSALEKILPILETKFPLSLSPGNPNEILNTVIIKD